MRRIRTKNLEPAAKLACISALRGRGLSAEDAASLWDAHSSEALTAAELAFHARAAGLDLGAPGAVIELMESWRADVESWALERLRNTP